MELGWVLELMSHIILQFSIQAVNFPSTVSYRILVAPYLRTFPIYFPLFVPILSALFCFMCFVRRINFIPATLSVTTTQCDYIIIGSNLFVNIAKTNFIKIHE